MNNQFDINDFIESDNSNQYQGENFTDEEDENVRNNKSDADRLKE